MGTLCGLLKLSQSGELATDFVVGSFVPMNAVSLSALFVDESAKLDLGLGVIRSALSPLSCLSEAFRSYANETLQEVLLIIKSAVSSYNRLPVLGIRPLSNLLSVHR